MNEELYQEDYSYPEMDEPTLEEIGNHFSNPL